MKGCATCIHLHRKCDGDCIVCQHAVGNDNPSTANAVPLPLHKGGLEAVIEQVRFGYVECKCDRCYDNAVSARDASTRCVEERKAEPYGRTHGETDAGTMADVNPNVSTAHSGRYKYYEENKEITRLLSDD